MKILIIAATHFELSPLETWYNELMADGTQKSKLHISFLVTGIGLLETGINLSDAIKNNSYDCIIQIGIAGSFTNALSLGQVVQVCEETYGDFGAEKQKDYLTANDLNWDKYQQITFNNNYAIDGIEQVKSISVQMCSGNIDTINYRSKQFNASIENMEGLAFFRLMQSTSTPYFQFRSISNYVEPRDLSKWNIPLAITNLTNFMQSLIQYNCQQLK